MTSCTYGQPSHAQCRYLYWPVNEFLFYQPVIKGINVYHCNKVPATNTQQSAIICKLLEGESEDIRVRTQHTNDLYLHFCPSISVSSKEIHYLRMLRV